MLKIGDFSSLSQVSIKTLRHYDDLGLLKPVRVDAASGYRYYSASQLPKLNRILALKDLGFSLEQISSFTGSDLSVETLRGMLLLRQAEQEQRVQEEAERLSRIRARLSLIEQEESMSQADIVIKSVPRQWLASIREVVPNYMAVGKLYPEVCMHLGPQAAGGLAVAIWHDREYKESNVDAEVGFYLAGPIPSNGRIQVHELPAATMACLVHQGAYESLPRAYDALLRWIEASGRAIAGPIRELYIVCSVPVRRDDSTYVTEIQVPIADAAGA